jgi:zinc transporter ZupT
MENDTNTNENKTAPQTNSAPATDSIRTSPTTSGKTNTMAIMALVLTFVFPPIGLIIGVIALRQIKKTKESGKGLAVAAVALSSLWVGLLVAVIITLQTASVRDGIGVQQGENAKLPK